MADVKVACARVVSTLVIATFAFVAAALQAQTIGSGAATTPSSPSKGSSASVADAAAARFDEANTWAFDPPTDAFSADAWLDLRSLNERVAGETGFVRIDAQGDFLSGDGRPLRFWAVNTNVGRAPHVQRPLWPGAAPDLARHARFLAKRGVNLVRLHRQLSSDLERHPDADMHAIDAQERDGIWRTVAAMKREGIYSVVSPYWAQITKLSPRWGLPGGASQSANGLLFFDAKLQGAYKAWLKQLLEPVNPYTGIALAKDPALAVFQLQNEDSLLFWTLDGIQGVQREALESKFWAFLVQKHGTEANLKRAWHDDRDPRDAPGLQRLAVLAAWEMTRDPTALSPGRRMRVANQTEFLTRLMHDFNRDIVTYLRTELGLRMPINANNWKTASVERLNDAERWSYRAGEVDAANIYTHGIHQGTTAGWAIVVGDTYTDASVLHQPWRMPLALRQGVGRPMMVTEAAWVLPTLHGAEAPLLVAAYGALSGVDAYAWLITESEGFEAPRSANGYLASQSKWSIARPEVMGGFPAAALAFRRGDLQRGTPAGIEVRTLDDLWQRTLARASEVASFDPNRDDGAQAWTSLNAATPTAFLEGPVQVSIDGQAPSHSTPINPRRAASGDSVVSVTQQIELNSVQGWLRVDSPRTQGVAAHFGRVPRHSLSHVDVLAHNHHASLIVTSLDDAPIASAGRVLLQATTRSRPMGWREVPVPVQMPGDAQRKVPGLQIQSVGQAPWRVERLDMRVTVRNPGLRRAVRLDANGMPSGPVALTRDATGVSLMMPPDALYVVLTP